MSTPGKSVLLAIVVLLILVAGLGLGAVAYLKAAFSWPRPVLSGPNAPDYEAVAAEGQPVLVGILRCKNEIGLWPETLDDLVPRFVGAVPAHWQFTSHPCRDDWRLFRAMPNGVHVEYVNGESTWVANAGRDGEKNLTTTRPRVDLEPVDPARRLANTLAELDRRIARAPAELIHRQGKISLLVRLGRRDLARAESVAACEALPGHWWPRMVLAQLQADSGDTAAGIEEFQAWVELNPSFSDYRHLSVLLRRCGDNAGAVDAIREAAKYKVDSGPNDSVTASYMAYDAATYAYAQGDYELALQVADSWCQQISYDRDAHAVRALSLLALERVDDARTELRIVTAEGRYNGWLGEFDALRSAVERGDASYRHSAFELCGRSPNALYIEYR